MKKYVITSCLCLMVTLSGCEKKQVAEKNNVKEKKDDIVFINEDNKSIGYYKSSIIEVDGNINVWLHMPNADKDSKKEIERVSEILAEISCKLRQIRLMKASDITGKDLTKGGDKKWDNPSPTSVFYHVIIKVCDEVK